MNEVELGLEIVDSKALFPLKRNSMPLLLGRSRSADIQLDGRSISGHAYMY